MYGDGTRGRGRDGVMSDIILCLQGLYGQGLNQLACLFENIGFHFSIDKRNKMILTGGKTAVNRFLDWLGQPELECFAYKFTRPSVFKASIR